MLTSEETSIPVAIETTYPSTVILRTEDGTEFAVPTSQITNALSIVAILKNKESPLEIIHTKGNLPTIFIPHVSSLILSKILAYCACSTVKVYDESTFVVDQPLFEQYRTIPNEDLLQLAFVYQFNHSHNCKGANLLDIPALLHTVSEVLAQKINDHDGDEIKTIFNLDSIVVDEHKNAEQTAEIEKEDWEEIDEMNEDLI